KPLRRKRRQAARTPQSGHHAALWRISARPHTPNISKVHLTRASRFPIAHRPQARRSDPPQAGGGRSGGGGGRGGGVGGRGGRGAGRAGGEERRVRARSRAPVDRLKLMLSSAMRADFFRTARAPISCSTSSGHW